MEADVVIVGTGVAGLFHALHLPENLHIIMITKEHIECSGIFNVNFKHTWTFNNNRN